MSAQDVNLPDLNNVEEGRIAAVANDFPPINGVQHALARLLQLATTKRPCEHELDCSECQDADKQAEEAKTEAEDAIIKAEDEIELLIGDATIPATAQEKLKALKAELADARRWL